MTSTMRSAWSPALLAALLLVAPAGCARQPDARELVVVSDPARPGAPEPSVDRPAAAPAVSLPSAPEAFGMAVTASRLYLQLADATALFMSLVCR